MKILKITLLLFLIILTSGCYDYQEVNNLDIITGLGIDYQNEQFAVTIEILKNTGDKAAIKLDTDIITGTGYSLVDALANVTSKLNKVPNYSHLKVMVITNNAFEQKWFSIMDFFLRNTDFRENFYVISTSEDIPTIFNTKEDSNKVVSLIITNYLENQTYNTVTKKFEDYAKDYVTFNKSLIFTNITVNDNKLIPNGANILKNNSIYYLSNNDLQTYNLFTKDYKKIVLNNYYDNKVFSIIITNSNLDISIDNNTTLVKGTVSSKILNNETNLNIRDLKTISMLNSDFKTLLEDNITNLFKIIKEYNTDIFGIDNKNYQINRTKINNYWLNQDLKLDINFSINKKGLIYEVDNEK